MKTHRNLFALFGLIFLSQASAVALNSGKEGQVLIFPYFSNLGGNQTLIQISKPLYGNDALTPRALKFHFRDKSGQTFLSFNLYLTEKMWAAAIATVNGQPKLILPDDSCTVPQLKQPGSNAIDIPLTSGFFEVIEMGMITDLATSDAAKSFDCDRLEAMWEEGGVWRTEDSGFTLAPSKGRLRGTAQLVNVQEGTLYSMVATALTEFSDIPQHTGPESETPNLSTPHDEGTASGNTKSVRCFASAPGCIEDTWVRPRDAVAAILSTNELRGEYTINDEIGAKAEFVITFPLQHHNELIVTTAGVGLDIADVPHSGLCQPLLSLKPCSGAYGQATPGSVLTGSFNDSSDDFGALVTSDILKDTHTVSFPEPGDPALPNSANFSAFFPIPIPALLTSNSGNQYPGLPVIGYVFQKYTNGQLTNEQGERIKANYGNAFELSQKGR